MESPARQKARKWIPVLIVLLVVNLAVFFVVRTQDKASNVYTGRGDGVKVTVHFDASAKNAGAIGYADLVHNAAGEDPVTYLTVQQSRTTAQQKLIGRVEVVLANGQSIPASRLRPSLNQWQAAAQSTDLKVQSAAGIALGGGNAGSLDGLDTVWIVAGEPTEVDHVVVTFSDGSSITAR